MRSEHWTPLILSSSCITQIIPMRDAISLMNDYMRWTASGDLSHPPRARIALGSQSLIVSAGTTIGSDIFGARLYPGTGSRGSRGEVTILFDSASGQLKGICLGPSLGEWRCGAIGGLAVHLLAPPNSNTLGVLGCGKQARSQLIAAASVRRFERVLAYCRTQASREAFAETMQAYTGLPVLAVGSSEEVVCDADVLICATSSNSNVLRQEWLKPVVHINQLGSKRRGTCELPTDVYAGATALFTDAPEQLEEDLNDFALGENRELEISPLSDVCPPSSELFTSRERPSSGRSIFLSLGLTGTEVFLADILLERCREVPCDPRIGRPESQEN